jgi:hypothetical protein
MEKKTVEKPEKDIEEKMENISKEMEKKCESKSSRPGSSDAVYGLGFVGAAIYYISTATGFWMGVLGFLKAIVWPAFLVYGLLKFLGM